METLTDVKIISTIDLKFATLSMREDGIVHTNMLINDAITLEQAKEALEAFIKITHGINTPNLLTVNNLTTMDEEVMEFVTTVANNHGVADAFVLKSLPQKLLANFYMKFQNPTIPTKFFNSKEEAIEWLKPYRQEPR